MLKLSQSRVHSWRQCHQQYAYKFIDKLEPKRKARPLLFGSIIHKMLEAHINDRDPFEVLLEECHLNQRLLQKDREYYGELHEDISYIMHEYFQHWERFDGAYYPVEGHRAEIRFQVELDGAFIVQGTIDAFMRTQKQRWLVEHKTHATFPDDTHRWRNLQSSLYIHINDIMGWPFLAGTLWDYIRSKPPTRPALLQNGRMSEKAIDTLPSVVRDFLVKHRLTQKVPPIDLKTWFQRILTPVKHHVVNAVVADFITSGYDILRHSEKDHVRTIGLHCGWCAYEPLCRAALQGSDVEFVKEHHYEVATHDYDEAPQG